MLSKFFHLTKFNYIDKLELLFKFKNIKRREQRMNNANNFKFNNTTFVHANGSF